MSWTQPPPDPELGIRRTRYPNNPAHAMNLFGFLVLCLLSAVGLLLVGYGQRSSPDRLLLSGGSLLLVAVGAGLLLTIVGRLNVSATVYEYGFVLTDHLRRQVPCRWDEVTEVYETITYRDHRMRYPRYWRYTVLRQDGQPIRLDDAIKHNRKLGRLIQQEVHRRLMPQLIEAYQAGGTVTFGPQIGLNPQGIVSGGELLRWEQVAEIRYSRQGDVQISLGAQHRRWRRVPHSNIANYDTFKAMVDQALDLSPFSTPAIIHDPQQPQPVISTSDVSPNSIAGLSVRLGYDVRDLFVEGYSLRDVQGVLRGDYTLEELRQRKPGCFARWKRKF